MQQIADTVANAVAGAQAVVTPALEAAAAVAHEAGLPAYILGDAIEPEARDVGKANVHARAWAISINPRESLDNNDGHGFFAALGDSIVTDPTLTNINDFRAIMITDEIAASGSRSDAISLANE